MTYLIGTVHCDLSGNRRLSYVLDNLKPSVIGVEAAESEFKKMLALSEDLYYLSRKSMMAAVRWFGLNSEERALFFKLNNAFNDAYLFEYFVSKKYVEKSPGSSIVYIDKPLGLTDSELIGCQYIQNSLSLFYSERDVLLMMIHNQSLCQSLIDQMYSPNYIEESLREIKNNISLMPPELSNLMERVYSASRDEFMSEQIKININPDETQIFITGLYHLAGLKERLSSYKNIKIATLKDISEELLG